MASVPAPSPASAPDPDQQDGRDDSSLSASSVSSSSSPSFRPMSAVPTATADQPIDANDQGQSSGAAGGASAQGGRLSGLISKIMQKLGLTPIMLMGMFKGSIAPIIAISIYQATAVRELLTTIGYLSAIITILSLVPLPRGKFLQNLVLNLVATGVGAAMATLVLWSAVQARLHTSDLLELEQYIAEHGVAPYNSSQSAVCAVWLFANIWAVNTIRAKFPAFNLPAIIYSIFINISGTFGPQFPTFATADAFIKKILYAILIGLAIGAGSSLFVFPISTRQIVVKQMTGILGLSKKVIALEKEYLQGLEKADMFTVELIETSAGDPGKKASGPPLTQEQKTAMALRGVLGSLRELMGKTYADIKFAKRDVAFGYLRSKDFGRLYDHIRTFVIPMTGIGVIMDIFQKVGRERGWDGSEGLNEEEQIIGGFIRQAANKNDSQRVWNDIMQQLHEPFEILSEALIQGIDHAGILLHQFPQPKAQKKAAASKESNAGVGEDVEESGGELFPGQVGFSQVLQQKINLFNSRKGEILRIWARDKGLLRNGKLEDWNEIDMQQLDKRHNDQIQLFVVLYLEKLMQATGDAIMDFVNFAEDKHRDGSILKKHFIVPTMRQVKKWIASLFKDDDNGHAEDSPDLLERGGRVVFMGEGWLHKKDPEHLPPANMLERVGNNIRKIVHHFGSPESFFGLRVAVATMSIGIVAFLEASQQFFIEQRLVWALIIIAIGMTQTSGQSIFGFLARIGGTAIAMVNCYIIWYITDQKLPGVLVFLWLFTFVEFYFFFKYPRVLPMTMITIVTQYLIIGYELQVRALGVAAAAASGQAYYPLYELAPYRLATIAGASLLAFFWTVFPKPLTDGTWLRRDLSATLYLLANYSSVVYTTMNMNMTEDLGSKDVPGSAAHSLYKVRRKLFGKLSLLIPSIQAHTNFQNFEPSLGGKFPAALYQDLIQRCTRLVNYFTLMGYVLTYSPVEIANESDRAWMRALSEVLDNVNPVHTQILSTLTLISNALMSGQSLPPFISLPKPYELTRKLLTTPITTPKDNTDCFNRSGSYNKNSRQTDNDNTTESPLSSVASGSSAANMQQDDNGPGVEMWNLLDARNMEQKGYTEFAVLQVASTLVLSELHGLVQTTKKLVGTVDFSFRVQHDGVPAESSLENAIERTHTWASRATGAGGEKGKKGKRD